MGLSTNSPPVEGKEEGAAVDERKDIILAAVQENHGGFHGQERPPRGDAQVEAKLRAGGHFASLLLRAW